jgi:type IV secretory pathway TrbL component
MMNDKVIGRLQLVLLCLALGLTSACSTVSPEQLSAVDSKATSAASDARKAASDAAAAMKAAQAAQAAASAAQATADAAKNTAEAAMTCCNENKDRIERMFEKTMKK